MINQMKPQLALQLYTVRDLLTQDFAGTMEKIAAIGYSAIETAFFPEQMSAKEAGALFKGLGLTVMVAHCELPLGEQKEPVLEMVAALDCKRMIWHGWPRDEAYGSQDGIKRLADQYNAANAVARANGMSFGIHNHWWEFEPVAGRYAYQILLDYLEPSVFFEIDTYWVKTAGCDPVQVLKELGERAPLLHLKDGPATQADPMVAVGDGIMDFPNIFAARAGNIEWLIVEMDDCATDTLAAVEKSYHYLVGKGFAHGTR